MCVWTCRAYVWPSSSSPSSRKLCPPSPSPFSSVWSFTSPQVTWFVPSWMSWRYTSSTFSRNLPWRSPSPRPRLRARDAKTRVVLFSGTRRGCSPQLFLFNQDVTFVTRRGLCLSSIQTEREHFLRDLQIWELPVQTSSLWWGLDKHINRRPIDSSVANLFFSQDVFTLFKLV